MTPAKAGSPSAAASPPPHKERRWRMEARGWRKTDGFFLYPQSSILYPRLFPLLSLKHPPILLRKHQQTRNIKLRLLPRRPAGSHARLRLRLLDFHHHFLRRRSRRRLVHLHRIPARHHEPQRPRLVAPTREDLRAGHVPPDRHVRQQVILVLLPWD